MKRCLRGCPFIPCTVKIHQHPCCWSCSCFWPSILGHVLRECSNPCRFMPYFFRCKNGSLFHLEASTVWVRVGSLVRLFAMAWLFGPGYEDVELELGKCTRSFQQKFHHLDMRRNDAASQAKRLGENSNTGNRVLAKDKEIQQLIESCWERADRNYPMFETLFNSMIQEILDKIKEMKTLLQQRNAGAAHISHPRGGQGAYVSSGRPLKPNRVIAHYTKRWSATFRLWTPGFGQGSDPKTKLWDLWFSRAWNAGKGQRS